MLCIRITYGECGFNGEYGIFVRLFVRILSANIGISFCLCIQGRLSHDIIPFSMLLSSDISTFRLSKKLKNTHRFTRQMLSIKVGLVRTYDCPHPLPLYPALALPRKTYSSNRIRKRISRRAPADDRTFLFVLWR